LVAHFVIPDVPDVAKVFPSSETVNRSLRALAGIIRQREKVLAK
jgi:hypothetical protein